MHICIIANQLYSFVFGEPLSSREWWYQVTQRSTFWRVPVSLQRWCQSHRSSVKAFWPNYIFSKLITKCCDRFEYRRSKPSTMSCSWRSRRAASAMQLCARRSSAWSASRPPGCFRRPHSDSPQCSRRRTPHSTSRCSRAVSTRLSRCTSSAAWSNSARTWRARSTRATKRCSPRSSMSWAPRPPRASLRNAAPSSSTFTANGILQASLTNRYTCLLIIHAIVIYRSCRIYQLALGCLELLLGGARGDVLQMRRALFGIADVPSTGRADATAFRPFDPLGTSLTSSAPASRFRQRLATYVGGLIQRAPQSLLSTPSATLTRDTIVQAQQLCQNYVWTLIARSFLALSSTLHSTTVQSNEDGYRVQ